MPPSPRLRRRVLLRAATAAVLLGAAAQGGLGNAVAAAAEDTGAEAFITEVGQRTVAVLRETSLPVPERLARMKGVLNQAIDLDYVARIILGRHWRAANEQQRQEYLRLFDQIVVQAMAERIGSYAGQGFEITQSRPLDERDTFVSTRITQPGAGAQPFRVDWRVRRNDDGAFRVIDISAEGVSLVVTQRSEVDEIVNRSGVDGLLAEMRRRLAERNVSAGLPPT